MSSLKNARSVWDSLSDDYSTRHYTGTARCTTHGRDCPADLMRRVYFCARCKRERPLTPWLDERQQAQKSPA